MRWCGKSYKNQDGVSQHRRLTQFRGWPSVRDSKSSEEGPVMTSPVAAPSNVESTQVYFRFHVVPERLYPCSVCGLLLPLLQKIMQEVEAHLPSFSIVLNAHHTVSFYNAHAHSTLFQIIWAFAISFLAILIIGLHGDWYTLWIIHGNFCLRWCRCVSKRASKYFSLSNF